MSEFIKACKLLGNNLFSLIKNSGVAFVTNFVIDTSHTGISYLSNNLQDFLWDHDLDSGEIFVDGLGEVCSGILGIVITNKSSEWTNDCLQKVPFGNPGQLEIVTIVNNVMGSVGGVLGGLSKCLGITACAEAISEGFKWIGNCISIITSAIGINAALDFCGFNKQGESHIFNGLRIKSLITIAGGVYKIGQGIFSSFSEAEKYCGFTSREIKNFIKDTEVIKILDLNKDCKPTNTTLLREVVGEVINHIIIMEKLPELNRYSNVCSKLSSKLEKTILDSKTCQELYKYYNSHNNSGLYDRAEDFVATVGKCMLYEPLIKDFIYNESIRQYNNDIIMLARSFAQSQVNREMVEQLVHNKEEALGIHFTDDEFKLYTAITMASEITENTLNILQSFNALQ